MQKSIEGIERQLKFLALEIENKKVSQERLIEIQDMTVVLAEDLDKALSVQSIAGGVKDLYKNPSKYPKRRVKKAIATLLDYIKMSL